MNKKRLLGFAVLALLVACQPRINSRGNVTVADNLDKFIVGRTTMSEVISMCGTPSLHKDNYTWIYIGAKSEEVAFHEVEMKDKCIVKMTFGTDKMLRSVDRIPLSDDSVVLQDESLTPLITDEYAKRRAEEILQGKR